jgi:hypothetical protein
MDLTPAAISIPISIILIAAWTIIMRRMKVGTMSARVGKDGAELSVGDSPTEGPRRRLVDSADGIEALACALAPKLKDEMQHICINAELLSTFAGGHMQAVDAIITIQEDAIKEGWNGGIAADHERMLDHKKRFDELSSSQLVRGRQTA